MKYRGISFDVEIQGTNMTVHFKTLPQNRTLEVKKNEKNIEVSNNKINFCKGLATIAINDDRVTVNILEDNRTTAASVSMSLQTTHQRSTSLGMSSMTTNINSQSVSMSPMTTSQTSRSASMSQTTSHKSSMAVGIQQNGPILSICTMFLSISFLT